jgi:DNA-binding XRE family transcriptional regulator
MEVNAAKVIRRVRQKLELSQEALSRHLNATKGAVQHWERGRNRPDLARLLALRQLCPPGGERKDLEALIRQTQSMVAPIPGDKAGRAVLSQAGSAIPVLPMKPSENLVMMRRESNKLQKQVAKLEGALEKRNEQLRILENLAADLQREMAKLRAGQPAQAYSEPTTSK